MNLRKLFCTGILAGSFLVQAAQAQYTLNLKPGPKEGLDAELTYMEDACHNSGQPLPPHLINSGSKAYMTISDWTWNEVGCPGSTTRSLIKFSGLSTLPPGARITSATMSLYHPAPISGMWGNNYFPGTPLSNTNEGSVYLVDRSDVGTWNEDRVDWTDKPGYETGISAAIPVTNTQWNGVSTTDVTKLVQEIVNGGGINNGFYLKLNTEVHYRAQVYATSDHPDAALWPELRVRYTLPYTAQLSISPNPAKDKITVQANEEIASLKIVSVSGSTIQNATSVKEHNAFVSVSDLSPGLYFIEAITVTGKLVRGKFVKE
ncbi:hypothetical protein DBR32_15445 [Taibaiella sp. KBW10]|uniref:DNRLRE domain-containing protein n=1 Tax=Taibaiella sp. KBW10 TaxID=2153357 RepID=UPI000F5A3E60|nr:DNRLRE domain-containing protein [Taibaiella sp. KBW10]RQO29651.1 hypothetical protein DBR32_15445 [Taibaiella sp. KBW10]